MSHNTTDFANMSTDSTRQSYPGFEGRIGRVFATSAPWYPPRHTPPADAPNVVIVIADDMGFSDLGCYGSEIPTPHIDALADRGVRFTNHHTAPLCSPTRAAIMTGLNPHAAGVGMVTHVDAGFPGYTGELPEHQPTIAETFRASGYATLAVGKWHLCKNVDLSEAGSKHSWPLQRGFDQYFGFLEAATNLHHPHRLYEGNSVIAVDDYPDGYYLTDELTSRACRMIREVKTANPNKPFFMYYAHGAPHAPLHAKPVDLDRHRGKYTEGWDVIRERRLARQIELGIMPPGTELPHRNSETDEDVRPWDDLSNDEQKVFARYMECYAAMITSIDESVGALIDELQQHGQLDNTIFVVTSDNGASREGRDRGSVAYFRDSGRLAGRATAIDEALDRFDDIGGPTTWPHYPRGWAMACNTPFRLYKISTFRGGHSVPFVLAWPRAVESGRIATAHYTHVADLLPTLTSLAGIALLTHRNGQPAQALDGRSFAAAALDPAAAPLDVEQYYECIGHRAYHRGEWRAVTFHEPKAPFSRDRWQLFHAPTDVNELHDVADDHPEVAQELAEAWERAAWRDRVFPLEDGTGLSTTFRPPYEAALAEQPLVILAGTPTIERFRASQMIHGRSFRIMVDLEYGPGKQGILVAHGGQESGYVLWIEDDQVHFEVNEFGTPNRLGSSPLHGSCKRIELDVEAPGARRWNLRLMVDGQLRLTGEGFQQFSGYLPFEGIDVGMDRRSPVSWKLYERHRTFPYTGTIDRVTYVPGAWAPDASIMRLEELRALGTGLE